jgi:hypothetical protein
MNWFLKLSGERQGGTVMNEQTFLVVASNPQRPKARGTSQFGVWSRRVAEGMGA